MKYQVKFIEHIEGRDSIIQGGVSFPIGETVTIDSDEVEMAPWFVGNSSFEIEEIKNEATENQSVNDDATEDRSDSGGSEDASQDDQEPADEVKAVKRVRKAATK